MVTETSKLLRHLIKAGDQTIADMLPVTTLKRRGVQHVMTRLAREGLVTHARKGKRHVWFALTDKGIGDRRGKALGSQTALARSHNMPAVRKVRLQNLQHLRFDAAGNYVPTVRVSECTLAQVWRISSCSASD